MKTARPGNIFLSIMLALVIALSSTLSTSAAAVPNSMAALGDSITQAYNTGSAFTGAPANSWSTGTNTTVNSLYRRFLAQNALISGKNYNYSVTGAKMVDLNTQAGRVGTNVEYVTILIGANDVCTSSESTMTSVTTFRSQFQAGMNTLVTRNPNVRVYVLSIPNVYQLWSVLKGNSSARLAWSLYRICQSMLAKPTSTLQADVDRRARVRQRNIDFNTQLAQICAQYAQCRFDGSAVFNTSFVASDISTRDYFHPSLAGQAKLAGTAWAASGFAP